MKNIFLIFLSAITLFLTNGYSQQMSLTNQYILSPGLINPAMITAYNKTEAFELLRNQWSGLSGAPSSQIFTLNGNLKRNKTYVGTTIMHDKIGLWNQLSFYGNFAYRAKINENTAIDFGLSLGGIQRTFDFNRAKVKDIEDPYLLGNSLAKFSFDASFGMNLVWKKLKFGVSSYQLLGNQVAYLDGDKKILYKLNRQFNANLQYRFTINENEKIYLIPILTTKYTASSLIKSAAPLQYDVNVLIDANKYGWFFVGYKSSYALTTGIGAHINKAFHFGFSYDFALFNNLQPYIGQTAEITLRYTFKSAGRSASQFLY